MRTSKSTMLQESDLAPFEVLVKGAGHCLDQQLLKTSSANSSGYWEDFEPSKSYDWESADLGSISSTELVAFKGIRSQKNPLPVTSPRVTDTRVKTTRRKQPVSSEGCAAGTAHEDLDSCVQNISNPSSPFEEFPIAIPETPRNTEKTSSFGDSHGNLSARRKNGTADVALENPDNSPRLPYGEDFCDSIESWLHDRPAELYRTTKTSRCNVLQLCFLTDSEHESDEYTGAREHDLEMNHTDTNPDSPVTTLKKMLIGSTSSASSSSPLATIELTEEDRESDNPFLKPSSSSDDETSPDGARSCEGCARRLRKTNRYFEYYLHESRTSTDDPYLKHRIEALQRKHKSDQAKIELSLSHIPGMARMQAEVERIRPRMISFKVQNLLRVPSRYTLTGFHPPFLNGLSVAQLQLIVNDMLSAVDVLNSYLLKELAERDELHLAQRSRLTEIDDIAAYGKELCQRCGMRKLRRSTLTQPMIAADFLHLRPVWMTGRLNTRGMTKTWNALTSRSGSVLSTSKTLDTFKKNLYNMFSWDKKKP